MRPPRGLDAIPEVCWYVVADDAWSTANGAVDLYVDRAEPWSRSCRGPLLERRLPLRNPPFHGPAPLGPVNVRGRV